MVGIYPPKNWKWWPASRSAQQRLPSGGHRAFGSAVRKGQCLKSASQAHSLGIFYLWESRRSVMHFRTLASQKKEKNNGEQQHLLKQLLLERWVPIGARAWSCVCAWKGMRGSSFLPFPAARPPFLLRFTSFTITPYLLLLC